MCGIFGYAKQQNAQNDSQIKMLKRALTYLADESVSEVLIALAYL